jgi:hypothetical protein
VAGEAYFNAAPVLAEDVDVETYEGPTTTKGVKVGVGETKTIEIDLFSDAKTAGPMYVRALDASGLQMQGNEPELDLSLDRTHGVNGEKLHLTITRKKAGDHMGSEFILMTSMNKTVNFWAGWVGN